MKLDKDGFVFTEKELKTLKAKNPTVLSICKLLEKEGFGYFENAGVRSKRFVIEESGVCAPFTIFRHYIEKINNKFGVDISYKMCHNFVCSFNLSADGKCHNCNGRSCYAHRFNDIMTGQIQTGRGPGTIDDGDIIFKNCIKVV